MSLNRFFNNLLDILPLSKARSVQVEANFTAVADGFTLAQAEIEAKLPLAGGSMTGDIAMGGKKVTGLADPTVASDAVTLGHVTTLFGSNSSAAASAVIATDKAFIAVSKAAEAAASADAAAASADSISSGPVTSVNGRPGVVIGLQEALVSNVNIKTIGGVSLLGSGNIPINAFLPGDLLTTSHTLSAPDWLRCDGSVYLQSSYTALFSSLGLLANGFTATARTILNSRWSTAGYGGGMFVALGGLGIGGTNVAASSPDGITWTARTLPAIMSWSDVAYGNGVFVAMPGSYSVSTIAATSPDGITWVQRTLPSSQTWHRVAFGNGIFVAINSASSNIAATSSDGITWTLRTLSSANYWTGITYGNGVFVVVTSNNAIASTSPDGITWTARVTSSTLSVVAFGGGVFAALFESAGSTVAASSPDGITWTARTTPFVSGSIWRRIDYGNGLFIAISAAVGGSEILTSKDGITWVQRTLPSSQTWSDVACGNGVFVMVADAVTASATAVPYAYNPSIQFSVPSIADASNLKTYIKGN